MPRWTPAPIIGGAYSDDTRAWSCQDTVNYIPVRTERPGGRSDWKLVCAPGFYMVADTGSNAPIRGMRNVEGLLLVAAGTTLYKVSPKFVVTAIGTIPGVLRVTMAHNQIAGGNQVAISNGQSGYVYNTVSGALTQITDDGFPGALSFDFVDGYITGIDPSRNFAYTSDLADATSYNTLDRYEAEGSPDKLVGQIVDHREWWLFGERTIEPFQNTGASTGTFERSGGTVIDVGAASTHAIVKMDNSVFWLGSDGVVYRANGYTPVRISTFPIEQAIARSTMSSAFAFTFEDRGHKIFYLTFQDGQTWGYDVATQEWHRRESRGLGRWRINGLVQWNGMWIGGDFSNGKLYRLDWNVMHEDGEIMERRRVTGVLHDSQNAVIVSGLALVIDTGLPAVQAPLSISGDAPDGYMGTPYSYASYAAIGGVGPYTFALVDGSLPPLLSMSGSNAAITGIPTTKNLFKFTLQVTDSTGKTARLTDHIFIDYPPLYPVNFPIRYLVVSASDTVDYSGIEVDDSAWPYGLGPFGNRDDPYAEQAGFPLTPVTAWPLGTDLWYRAPLEIELASEMHFRVFADDEFTMWVNGEQVAHRNNPYEAEDVIVSADKFVAGLNILAFRSHEISDTYSYFSFEVVP